MYKVGYDGNDNWTYTLFFNRVPQAELLLNEDDTIEIVDSINAFLSQLPFDDNGNVVEIKNDDDKLGVIVDVWDSEKSECIDTRCFWFDDFRE